MKLLLVVGTRPNFVKAAPLVRAIEHHNSTNPSNPIDWRLVHTGQHYDDALSAALFRDLGIGEPHQNLNVGSGTHGEQTGRTMMAIEEMLQEMRPDWTVVFGDVNATLAVAITAKKLCLKVAHVEAGLRSHDWTMPEEINRVVTDRIADLNFATTDGAIENLRREGIEEDRLALVGNIMIDSLDYWNASGQESDPLSIVEESLLAGELPQFLPPRGFALCTLHRPATVDDPVVLTEIVEMLDSLAERMPLIMPLHPRTENRLRAAGLIERTTRIVYTRPLSHSQILSMVQDAAVVLTDSGGLQEECCVLGRPFVVLRWNTERPETLRQYGGTGEVCGTDAMSIRDAFHRAILDHKTRPHRPDYWDGETAPRILSWLIELASEQPYLAAQPT